MSDDVVGIGQLAERVGRSISWLRRQADLGRIPSVRTEGGHRRFDVVAVEAALAATRANSSDGSIGPREVQPSTAPDWHRRIPLNGLEEDVVWGWIAHDLTIDRSTSANRISQYAFTEMLNNAIDHSDGATAVVDVWLTTERLSFRIVDDGVGVFYRLSTTLGLPEPITAIVELTKGKRTTMADRHSGEGIFFTSKAVDLFQLASGGLRWTVDNLRGDQAVGVTRPCAGTTVFAQIQRDSDRDLQQLFETYTEDHVFTRTRPSVELLALGQTFVSRSEAKRLVVGLEAYEEVRLDFQGVTDVGQAFVDEVFRVWASQHPRTAIVPVNMNEAVEFMVKRAQGATIHEGTAG